MKYLQKKIKYALLLIWQMLLLAIVLTIACDTPMWVYLIRQAKGQLYVIYHTQKVATVLEKNNLDWNEIHKIKLIQEIKLYAENEIGLNKTNNYTTFYNQHSKPILWMLTACEPFAFKEKVWQFPLLGEVSYKGFFDYNLAISEANYLKMQHYNVDVGKVSAWSTLGILSDPILSSMLENEEGELAELIIHELTHATLYFPNNVDFNENFASFVGRQGAIQFLKNKYGSQSKQLEIYLKDVEEETILKRFLFENKEMLSLYYASFDKNMDDSQKDILKQKKLSEVIQKLYLLNIYNWKTKIKIAQKIRLSGNAYFMSFNRYDAQYEQLLKSFNQQNNKLKKFIQFHKNNKANY
jgi:predicted aminopeptidase